MSAHAALNAFPDAASGALTCATRDIDKARTALAKAKCEILAAAFATRSIVPGAKVRKARHAKPFGETFAFLGAIVTEHGEAVAVIATLKKDGTQSARTHHHSGELTLA